MYCSSVNAYGDQHRTDEAGRRAPSRAALLRLVLSLVMMVLTRVLPRVAHRPDLRAPLLAAVRALCVVAWRHLRIGGTDEAACRRALHRAALALARVLEVVVEAEEGGRVVSAPPFVAGGTLPAPPRTLADAWSLRAREGPPTGLRLALLTI